MVLFLFLLHGSERERRPVLRRHQNKGLNTLLLQWKYRYVELIHVDAIIMKLSELNLICCLFNYGFLLFVVFVCQLLQIFHS